MEGSRVKILTCLQSDNPAPTQLCPEMMRLLMEEPSSEPLNVSMESTTTTPADPLDISMEQEELEELMDIVMSTDDTIAQSEPNSQDSKGRMKADNRGRIKASKSGDRSGPDSLPGVNRKPTKVKMKFRVKSRRLKSSPLSQFLERIPTTNNRLTQNSLHSEAKKTSKSSSTGLELDSAGQELKPRAAQIISPGTILVIF